MPALSRKATSHYILLLTGVLIILVCPICSIQAAASVTLAWDPAPNMAGYRLYCGTTSRVYTQTIEVGNTTTTLVSNLVAGQTYFFAIAAYNSAGLESPFSNEVSYPVSLTAPTPTPTVNTKPDGSLDGLQTSPDRIWGWAADADRATVSINVVLKLDGNVLTTLTANVSRPDVTAAFPKFTGNHGFIYVLPNSMKDGKTHTVSAFGIDDNGTQSELPRNSPRVLIFPTPTPTPTPTGNTKPDGSLDGLQTSPDRIWGWAADADRPTVSIYVVLKLDGNVLTTLPANVSRPDVTTAFPKFTGNHGFIYVLPTSLKDGKTHTVSVFGIDDNGTQPELPRNSPRVLVFPTPTPTPPP
jgi:hypothetical protein